MDRIAIFQYEWPILSYTVNLAKKLAESGYIVDYFASDCSSDFYNFADLNNSRNVSLHVYSSNKKRILENIIKRRLTQFAPFDLNFNVISNDVLFKSMDVIKLNSYRCFIGIEKKGMIWAGKISEIYRVPYLYYSLELYMEDILKFQNDNNFKNLRLQEKKYHRLSKATIIAG